MPVNDTEDELDDMLKEAEQADLPLKNKVMARVEAYIGDLPNLSHGRRLAILGAAAGFLVLVYLAYIFIAPSFTAGAVRDAPLTTPNTTTEQTAAQNAEEILRKIEGVQRRAAEDPAVKQDIQQLGSFEFLLVVTSTRDGDRVKIWSAEIAVENGSITRIQRDATRADTECIGWMSAAKMAEIQLTGEALARQIVQGNVKIAPSHCSTNIARKAANIVLQRG